MRCLCCGSSFGCCRSMGWGWRGMRRRAWRRAGWYIICGRPSRGRWNTWRRSAFMSARGAWSSMRFRCGTWSWWTRCFLVKRRRLRCSTRSMPAVRRWANGCCGLRCCGRRWDWRGFRRGWMRWGRRRGICASGKGFGARWMGCWTWSGCWGGWRWILRGRGRCWRWPGRWGVCLGCGGRFGRLRVRSGASWGVDQHGLFPLPRSWEAVQPRSQK